MFAHLKDPIEVMYEVAVYSITMYDGGPRGYRRRGSQMPDRYMPGKFLMGLRPEKRDEIVAAANSKREPAPWVLKILVEE